MSPALLERMIQNRTANASIKGQIINILTFAGPTASVAATQAWCSSTEAPIDNV